MRARAVIVAAAIILGPLNARGADLVVWWEKGFYPQEDEAIAEIISVFEESTGQEVELSLLPLDEILSKAEAALEAGEPPDFLWSTTTEGWFARWAYEDRLVDLEDALAPVLDLFDPDAIQAGTLLNGRTGEHGLYGLPMGRWSNHIHVWNNLLEDAGLTLADIPQEWDAFWSFWCDEVQPAVRQALGRDDIWGIGLPMSAQASLDTQDQLFQFQLAYEAPWVSGDGALQLDDAAVRDGLIKAMRSYTTTWLKNCTPPDSASWAITTTTSNFLSRRS